MWSSSRLNAYTHGLEHTITVVDIVIPDRCPVFDTPMYNGGKFPHSMSLDKVDPGKGYVPGNVRVVSFKANRLKNNGTLDDFRRIVKYLEGLENDDHTP
jgi:hypothetical protein